MATSADWKKTKIVDFCSLVTSGGTPFRKKPDFYGGSIPWFKTGELNDWYLYDSEEKITPDAIKSSSAKIYPLNTILMAMYGDGRTIGSLGVTKIHAASNQACCAMVVDEKKCDHLFLFYALKFYRNKIVNLALGGAQRNLNQGTIKNFEIKLPPLETQRKIASILSAYDDLIENNTRRIKILEEMAQAIYREWFVNFRFPGHEQVKMVDSTLGRVPEGWEVKTVTEAVEVNPRTKVPKEGEKPFVPMGSLSNDSMLISDIETRGGNSGSKFKNGDTLFARITPCLENGKTGYVQFLPDAEATAFGSTEFIVLRSRTLCPEYVYLMARSSEFRDHAIKSMSGATGRQRVSDKCFDQFFLVQPDPTTLDRFSEIAAQNFKQIFMLANKNKNLRQTRDLLLPKLISGAVDLAN